MPSYRELADDLRQRIDGGEFPPGSKLPKNSELTTAYGVSKETVSKAIARLADAGLVITATRGGTIVRRRTAVRLPVSRYRQVLEPGGSKGPWETTTKAAGLDGTMRLMQVESVVASEDLAALLGLPAEAPLVYRLRHALIRSADGKDDDVVQLQHAWYPQAIALSAGLDTGEKVVGGAYGALTAAGHRPASASESVAARAPSDDEAGQLRISGRVPVLTLERITRDASGQALEVLRAVAPADRLTLTYDDLPL
ncbi:GntR family transcriptional regulator [Streptomyces sp. NPDC017941]|uniref:GntR family transcriptional regulator n=1 Tax=Streptomyces sp. NPDC017941 TaxID=3365018 RepID=UPI0037B1AF92